MTARLENIVRFRADVERCMKCGFCAHFCPVYRVERQEKGLARGKNQLIRLALEGEQGLTPGFRGALDNCLLCKTCVQYCPAKTRIDHAIVAARADCVARRGLPFSKRIVFRHILPHRTLFGAALRVASWFQWMLPRRAAGGFRHLPLFLTALGAGRTVPDIAARFLRRRLPEHAPARGRARRRVGLFAGCATEYMFPEIGERMVEVLRDLDCEVVMPRGQGCCGAPVILSGDIATGLRMALRNAAAFEGCEHVVTGCATCGSAMKEYPTYLAADAPGDRARLEAFAGQVRDFNEFVIDTLAVDPARFRLKPRFAGRTVTWHDPCHLVRHQGVAGQPRRILGALDGLRFVEMRDADRCCGLGGSFSVTHYATSKRIADAKADAIAGSGADAVVTACPGCIVQLRDVLARRCAPVEVLHIGELFEVGDDAAPG